MRHSKGAASLLSTVFAFRSKSVVGANVFDPINEDAILHPTDVGATAPSDNNADAGILSPVNPTRSHPTIDILKQKCKVGDEGCILGKIRATNSGADIGILPPSESADMGTDAAPSMATASSTCAADKLIDCDNGFVRNSNPAKTCAAACNGQCCTGENACDYFTGKVCKDDSSCTGDYACFKANILSVVNSCMGNRACLGAGYDGDGGLIGSIADSCIGDYACRHAATFGGSIGNMTNSCNGVYACLNFGHYKGKIGKLVNSCIGDLACYAGARQYGSIGSITGSCTGYQACRSLGQSGGTVGDITNSCTAEKSCFGGAEAGGVIGGITNSCTSASSCRYGAAIGGVIGGITNSCTQSYSCSALGRGAGKAGNVKDSCTGDSSCMNAGKNRGSIGNISSSCNADKACESAGSGSTGAITSNLMGCCNTPYVCQSATQTTLPRQCNSKVRQK